MIQGNPRELQGNFKGTLKPLIAIKPLTAIDCNLAFALLSGGPHGLADPDTSVNEATGGVAVVVAINLPSTANRRLEERLSILGRDRQNQATQQLARVAHAVAVLDEDERLRQPHPPNRLAGAETAP